MQIFDIFLKFRKMCEDRPKKQFLLLRCGGSWDRIRPGLRAWLGKRTDLQEVKEEDVRPCSDVQFRLLEALKKALDRHKAFDTYFCVFFVVCRCRPAVHG